MIHKRLQIASAITFALALLYSSAPIHAMQKLDAKTYYVMGKVESCDRGYVVIEGTRFYLTPGSRVYSQAHRNISISKICEGGLVNLIYYKIGDHYVIEKLKLLDLVGTGMYQTFQGTIEEIKPRSIELGQQRIFLDDFTIRLGDNVQQNSLRKWLGTDVTIVALQNDAGMWVAEIVRESIELTALTSQLE